MGRKASTSAAKPWKIPRALNLEFLWPFWVEDMNKITLVISGDAIPLALATDRISA